VIVDWFVLIECLMLCLVVDRVIVGRVIVDRVFVARVIVDRVFVAMFGC